MTEGSKTPRRPRFGGDPHPWFRPLWRRVGIFVLCLGWLAFELYQQDPLWIAMVAGATTYAAWDFFLRGAYSNPPAGPGA
jgi:hypothetical protein